MAIINGEVPIAHARPDLRRLAENTFRTRMDRAIEQGSQDLIEELIADCPFWKMGRDELLEQDPTELRRWHRLLRFPKDVEPRWAITDFVRSLHHAAGLIDATMNPDE